MRKPREIKCKKSKKYPKGVKYTGAIEYRGQQLHIGTFATATEWHTERRRVEKEFTDRVDAMKEGRAGAARRGLTVAQFANMTFDAGGRAVPLDPARAMWPWSHPKPKRTREISAQRANEALRRFIRDHGGRRLDSFTRDEARQYALSVGANTRQSIRQFFGDALDDEVISGRNYFANLGIGGPSKRKDDDDFEIIDDAFFETLQQKAIESRPEGDAYAHILVGLIVWMGWTCCRPSELFSLTHDRVFVDRDEFVIPRAMDKGKRGKELVLPPAAREAYLSMPRISELVFPGPQGRKLSPSGFNRYWHPIRVAAGDPKFQLYKLKHYAITRLIAPPPWGMGLDPLTAAGQAGHSDDGRTILRYYAKLRQQETRGQIKQAMADHHAAHQGRRLRAV